MEFIFAGFYQDNNVRRFAFHGVAADRTRTKFTVGADLLLIRKYQIALQDLPLLCRRLLEEASEGERARAVMFTEDHMRVHANNRAAARELAAHQRRRPHKPPGAGAGSPWRGRAT